MNLMGSIENPSAQPLQGNNNPQVATPTLQNQQPLEPTITYSSSTPESAPKKKISIKKLLLFFFGLILIAIIIFIGAILFSTRVLHRNPYLVVVPKIIPTGFVRADTVQSERYETGRFFVFTYNNPSGKKFTYHLQFDAPETKKCSPPQTESTFISDYQVFRPKDSSNGCAMTLTDKDGNKSRVYKWRSSDNTQFFVFADNLSVSEQEVLTMANSPKVQLIFVGGYVDPNTGKEVN